MAEMRSILPGYEIRPLKDYLSLMNSTNLPGLNDFVGSMIGLAVAIGFLVIFLSMYTTVVERTRDIGVLKSMGASRGYIIRALLGETAIICAVGILLGFGLSYLVRAFFLSALPHAHNSDHSRLARPRRLNLRRRRTPRRLLSLLARQPQRRRRGPRLRLKITQQQLLRRVSRASTTRICGTITSPPVAPFSARS